MKRLLRMLPRAAILAALAGAGCAAPGAGGRATVDGGALVSRLDYPGGGQRDRAIGPLLERQQTPDATVVQALHPVVSRARTADGERTQTEWLWPLGISRIVNTQRYTRVFTVLAQDFDTTDARSRWRFWAFPFLFMGRDAQGDRYGALFPIGGRLNEFMGYDRTWFVLFPLYANCLRDDVRTHEVLWPIISRSKGGTVDRWRVFPLYGISRRGDTQMHRFILWPFWTDARYRDPDYQGYGYVLFPLWGRINTTGDQTWMVAPPLFRYSKRDHGRRTELHCPYPFVQISRGGPDKTYVWPLWGRKRDGDTRSGFALWPLITHRTVVRTAETFSRWMVLPFWQAESRIAHAPATDTTGVTARVTARYRKLWPLGSYRREGAEARLRIFDLWPFKYTPGIERNWAPLWSLYTHARSGAFREDELLWGLFRWRRQEHGPARVSLFPLYAWQRDDAPPRAARRWSVLGGLLARDREGLRDTYRVLYVIKFNVRRRESAPQP